MDEDINKTLVKPRNTLLTMKERNEKNMMRIKQVYNAMNIHQRSQRGHKIEMQQFMLLERDMYVHWYRCEGVSNVMQDIFRTHPDSVHLVNSFNIVILMDSTYKIKSIGCRYLRLLGLHQLV